MLLKPDLKKIPFIDKIAQTASEQGTEIFFVGGCVRDMLLERHIKDIDMVPFGTDYEKFAFRLAKRLRAAAVSFKDNVRLARGGLEFDVSAPRGADIYEDLSKRDFTVNNLALSTGGEVIGDDADIRAGLIRIVHESAFDDDPLRVLRMYRFASQLGFEIDGHTAELAAAKAHMLNTVAAERIFAEMQKLAEGAHAASVLTKLVKDGVLRLFSDTSAVEEARLLKALEGMAADDLFVKTSAFIYGFRNEALKVMDRQCYPVKLAKRAANTASAYSMLESMQDYSVDNLMKYIYTYKEDWILGADMFTAVNGGSGLKPKLNTAFALMRFDNESLIDGKALSEMGVPAGKLMGEIIRDASFRLVSGRLKDKEDAENYIKNTYGERIDEAAEIQNRKG
ncbi:hypothetical protein EP073_01580 [Geovibrio thiophilus]|uniref:CCA tRNA nucleotidyltransferase n=1 Tax=Geovibrio thiophilus TaxID=139438 RepID=A0A3R5UZK4_9BACT|nr:hypothetical protein [Geovibrio thiophilus]QAR32133.1 hypothetical protein EP073_01580 [Geovibrio thiophilus]